MSRINTYPPLPPLRRLRLHDYPTNDELWKLGINPNSSYELEIEPESETETEHYTKRRKHPNRSRFRRFERSKVSSNSPSISPEFKPEAERKMSSQTPPLTHSTSSTPSSSAYSSQGLPLSPNESNALIFFPEQDGSGFYRDSERDVFNSSTTQTNLPRDKKKTGNRIDRNKRTFNGDGLSSSPILNGKLVLDLGLGDIESLPDEQVYSNSQTYDQPHCQFEKGKKAKGISTSSKPKNTLRENSEWPFNVTGQRAPLSRICSEKWSKPSHLPPSAWKQPEFSAEAPIPSSDSTRIHHQSINHQDSTPRSSTSPLRRTDSETIHPSSPFTTALSGSVEGLGIRPTTKLNGHSRQKSNDSVITLKLGHGFVALNPASSTTNSRSTSPAFREDKEGSNIGGTQMIVNIGHKPKDQEPVLEGCLTQSEESIRKKRDILNFLNERSWSTNMNIPTSVPMERSISPVKPDTSLPFDKKPIRSPISSSNGSENYFEQQHHSNSSFTAGTTTTRFSRPVSPSLPEDTLTPLSNPFTYTHRTMSSSPQRPKSPTSAKESLNAVLTRISGQILNEDSDNEEGSLDRMIRAVQKFESGSSYIPRTPPKTPTITASTLPSSPVTDPSRAKHTKGSSIFGNCLPPSPPSSSPSLNEPDRSPHNLPLSSQTTKRSIKRFDIDKISERLKYQQGRISFEELEGFGPPYSVNGANDAQNENSLEELQEALIAPIESDREPVKEIDVSTDRKNRKQKSIMRPKSGNRRWTLPF
ncbi:uncharacterized protein L201_004688 [Kwoniella dendrophila CBS 6074]|uniref:Uncharacterized protein n=1 Tax=Kwoniella dendrophila CBS 6074 TaxID=1295534 RepID=A0AAX4JWJ7_9TREE